MDDKEFLRPFGNITPAEFELFVYGCLQEMGKKLNKFEVVHNTNIEAHDGNYQIDIKATFEAFECTFTVIIECKRYKAPIKRDVVQKLHTQLLSLGAHKGIIFSTSPFQLGAKEHAWQHGIALVQVKEGSFNFIIKEPGPQYGNRPSFDDQSKFVGEYNYEPGTYYILQPGNGSTT